MSGEFLTEINAIEIDRIVVYRDDELRLAYGRGIQFDDPPNTGVQHVVIS